MKIVNLLLYAAFFIIGSFFFYKIGWHKRNLQKNNYLQRQSDYNNSLWKSERELRRKTISRSYHTIKKLLDEIGGLNILLREKEDTIVSLLEAIGRKNAALKNKEAFPKSNHFTKARMLVEKNFNINQELINNDGGS